MIKGGILLSRVDHPNLDGVSKSTSPTRGENFLEHSHGEGATIMGIDSL